MKNNIKFLILYYKMHKIVFLIFIFYIILLYIITYRQNSNQNNNIKECINEPKKKVIINLKGGLGNQIFQICFAYSVAKKNNADLSIIKTISEHNKNNIDYYNTIFKNFPNIDNVNSYFTTYYEALDKFATFIPELLDLKNNTKFDGYFQTEKYFINYKEDILKLLTNNSVYDSISKYKNESYVIHIRRGDYVGNSTHYIDLDLYYSNAIKYITGIDNNAHFFIISNDIDYCKNYAVLKDINKTFYENNNELETLYFISVCNKGCICGNSSFAWWGSYLNMNSNKIVIFPDKWINFSADFSDIYYTNALIFPI
jgi:hypothetical protein